MRAKKKDTGLLFDAFKHLKNNMSNLVFLEFPLLVKLGDPIKYFRIKPVNYKSKYPDMKKMGLIFYKKNSRYELTELSEKLLNLIPTIRVQNNQSDSRLSSLGKDLFVSKYYQSEAYDKISKILLELQLNYYDDAVALRPYFLLIKIIINNKIKVLDDETLLDILSTPICDALKLKFNSGSFAKLNNSLKVEVKRPKSYIFDFLKTSKTINNAKDVIVDSEVVQEICIRMNEISSKPTTANTKNNVRIGQDEFREKVLKAYNFTCALTGKKISYPSKISNKTNYVLDAAHIIPYSDGGSFSVTNGIALSPEIHALYDFGLITFEYRGSDKIVCVVSKKEGVSGGKYLSDLDGKTISLPKNTEFWPDPTALNFKKDNYFIKTI